MEQDHSCPISSWGSEIPTSSSDMSYMTTQNDAMILYGPLALCTVLVLHFRRGSHFLRALRLVLSLLLSICQACLSATMPGQLRDIRRHEGSPRLVAMLECSLPIHFRSREACQSKPLACQQQGECYSLHGWELLNYGNKPTGMLSLLLYAVANVDDRLLR